MTEYLSGNGMKRLQLLQNARPGRWVVGAAVAAGLAFALSNAASPAAAVEQVKEIKWADLVPVSAPPKLKPFFAGRAPAIGGPMSAVPGADPTVRPSQESGPDARWMSAPGQATRLKEQPAVVTGLDGKRVNIGGYVVPLDFDATEIKEFLLVPYVGACIHVPPPPPNQIVYVKTAKGFRIKSMFEPVYVTGKMTTTVAFTGLADAGYTLEAETVSPRKP
jgi:hypothetical protein